MMRRFAVPGLLILLSIGPVRAQTTKSMEAAWGELKAAGPHYSRGLEAFRAGRYDQAADAFKKSVQAMPRHAFALYYLANLSYLRADYAAALPLMERSLADFEFMRELGEYAGRLKLKRIGSYQQILEAEWDNTTSCRTSRELEALDDQLSDEQSKLDLAARKDREAAVRRKAQYVYFLGNILFQLKRFPEAAERYREAIALNPRHADAYNNAAAISFMAGEHAAARDLLARAEEQGLEDDLNLKLMHLVSEALGLPTEGILQEDLSGPEGEDLGVMRFALALKKKGSPLPPPYANAYVVFSRRTKEAVVIDPAVEDPRIGELVRERGLTVKAILVTHGHEDHAGAAGLYAGLFGAPVCASRIDAKEYAVPADRALEDGMVLELDGLAFRVIRTPGHTPGSLCFLIGDHLFSGDTLFKGGIGRVGGDDPAKVLLAWDGLVRIIRRSLLTLPGRTRVCPGHGKTSTIADEAAANPFLNR
jgi:glyoxylase-like metal-dependent hydrolase (beta-lactamase superfamily II)/Tfp pilus assembly protein PilF